MAEKKIIHVCLTVSANLKRNEILIGKPILHQDIAGIAIKEI